MRKFISLFFLGTVVFISMCYAVEDSSEALSWDATQTVDEDPAFVSPIDINENNESVVTWVDTDGNALLKSKESVDGDWSEAQSLSLSVNSPSTPFVSVNNSSQVLSVWLDDVTLYFASAPIGDTMTGESSGITVPGGSAYQINSFAFNDNNQAAVVLLNSTTKMMVLASYNNGSWSSATQASAANGSVSVAPSQKFVGTFKDTGTDEAKSMIVDFSISPNTWDVNTIGSPITDNLFHSVNSLGEVVASWSEQTTNNVKVALFSIDSPTVVSLAPLTGVSPLDGVRTLINDSSDLITSWVNSSVKPVVSTSTFTTNTWISPFVFADIPGLLGAFNNAGIATFYLSDSVDIAEQTVSNLKSQIYTLSNGTKGPVQVIVSEALKILEGTFQALFTSKVPSANFITMWVTKNPKLQTANGTSLGAGTRISGKRINNIFPTRKEYINQIKWSAFSNNATIASYNIYRDGTLIVSKSVSDKKNGIYTYNDRAQKKRRFVTYRVEEVLQNGSSNGNQSIQLP